jgi:oligopeptidase B
MKKRNFSLALAVTITTTALAQSAPAPTPPIAEKIHTEKPINGAVLTDDYAWLRERTNPRVVKYLEAENAFAEQSTSDEKPFAEKLYNETLSHIKQTDTAVPYRKRGYWYYSRTEEGKQYPILCRKKETLNAPEEVMLDVNQLAQGEKFMSVANAEVSDDNNLLAYLSDNVGFRQYRLHVKDLRTGKVLPDTAERVDSIAWAADNKTIFYSTEDAQTKRGNLIYRHVLGAAAADPVIYDEKDERYDVYVTRMRDSRYLMMTSESHVTTEERFLDAKTPNGEWKILEPRKEGVRYYADEANGLFYIRVNDTDPSFRLVTAPVTSLGKSQWTELIAARREVPLDDVDAFKEFYVVTERVKGLPVLQVISTKSKERHTVEVPEPAYSLGSAANAEFDTDKYRYSYQSPITPNSTFEYDVKKQTSTLLKQQEVPGGYDKTQYAVERLFVPAKDGVGIPVTVVYRKDKFKRGANPLFVYGYGSYGITIDDRFSVTQLPLLDRGVVTTVAHIRGGGELGEAWHDGGKMMTKRNTFTDFIDATEGLLAQGYGKRGEVGIEGASAGGLLMGAVTNMRPDLFKVVLCEVPFVDVMNTMLDATLPLTVGEYEEWGNPNQKAAFDYMLTYSPYDNVAAKSYPALLVQTSFDDSQVMYWEPSKYVAKLRALKTDQNPLVFFINMHGGHGGSSGRYDSIRERDRNYAFMLTQLGITQ